MDSQDERQAGDPRQRKLKTVVESLLFASGEPLSLARLLEIASRGGFADSKRQIRRVLEELRKEYEDSGRGIRLLEVAGGYQLRTPPEVAASVKLLFEAKPWRLTRATLETLAIVAYRQPVTRAEIEAIRGVDVDGVMGSLLVRKLVRVVGRKEAPGRPLLYGTTQRFLEVFGLSDLSSLPALAEIGVPDPAEIGVQPGAAVDAGQKGEDAGKTAEDSQPGGALLQAQGGGADQAGQGSGQWPSDEGAGEQG